MIRRLCALRLLLLGVLAFFLVQSSLAQSSPNPSRLVIPILQSKVARTTENTETGIPELVRQKRWKEVTELARRLSLKNPEDPTMLYWLGIARYQLQDPVGAVQALRTSEKLGLNTAVLHEGLGLAYYQLNQFFLFEQQMQKASNLEPQNPRPIYALGLYHVTIRSDFAGALEFFDKATQLQPDDPKSLYQKGHCLEQMGRQGEARECYARAIGLVEKRTEHFGWPFQGMARLVIEENPQKALDCAKKAVEVEPQEYSHHLILAKVYERLGSLPEALREARAAKDQNPTSSTARYALFKLYQQLSEHQASEAELMMFKKLKGVYGPE